MNPKRTTTSPQQARSDSLSSLLLILATLSVLLLAVIVYIDRNLNNFSIFDPKELQEIASNAINLHGSGIGNGDFSQGNLTLVMNTIVSSLVEKYGQQHINTFPEWIFNNAGGAMGAMWILHASITEYLIFFGTPLGTEGHTGRFLADDYFTILQGQQWAFLPGSLKKEIYLPGDSHHLPRGIAKQYKMHQGCFALEYARGWIPSMLFFGFADTFSSTLDFKTLRDTVKVTTVRIFKEFSYGKF